MISKSKPGVLALVAIMGIATPAFAETLDSGTAASLYGWDSPQANAISGASSSLRAFGMVPRAHNSPGVRAFDIVPGAAFGSAQPHHKRGGH